MSVKKLITREIQSRRELIRGVVVTPSTLKNYDPNGLLYPVWVVTVDIGQGQLLVDVPVKVHGRKARAYAKIGSPVFLQKNGSRYEVIGPGDRTPQVADVQVLDEDADDVTAGQPLGFTFETVPFPYYQGTTPESFYDPAADANVLLWLQCYGRLNGRPQFINPLTDTGGARVLGITDRSGNGASANSRASGNDPLYRRFETTGGNVNARSAADFDGTNDVLDLAANVVETVPGAISIFALVNKDAAGAGDDVILELANWRLFSRITAGDTWGFENGGGVLDSTRTIGTSFKLIELVASAFNNVTLYDDADFVATFTTAAAGLGLAASFLGSNAAASNSHNGRIIEVLVIDGAVGEQKRLDIEEYFNQTLRIPFSRWNDGATPFPKVILRDGQGNEVTL